MNWKKRASSTRYRPRAFVAPKNTELLREENLKKIEAHLTEAVRLSASCGLGKSDLREMLELLWEG